MDIVGTKTVKKHILLIKLSRGNMGKDRTWFNNDNDLIWFCSEHPWSLWIWTSDLPNAGTDADISFQVYGEKGKSDEIRLDNKTDNFEQGQVDRFMESIPYFNHTLINRL